MVGNGGEMIGNGREMVGNGRENEIGELNKVPSTMDSVVVASAFSGAGCLVSQP